MTIPNNEHVDEVIQRRRTCMRVDTDRPVDVAVLNELCRLATFAPNHYRTEPWRFAVLTGNGRTTFGNAVADEMAGQGFPPTQVEKTRTKYLRTPATIVMASEAGDDELHTLENQFAVAAAAQNLLLAATARGLATFWGSVATPTAPRPLSVCGFAHTSRIIAAIYVGYASGTCAAPGREPPSITAVTD